MINLPTKFEVSNFGRYGDMKVLQNVKKWGGRGWLGVTQGHRQRHQLIQRIRFPIRL